MEKNNKGKRTQKLIRDRVGPDTPGHKDYLAKGLPDYEVDLAPQSLITILLVGKLHEEAEEVREDQTNPEEYADVLQTLMDLAYLNGVSFSEVEYQRKLKLGKKGGFTGGKVLRREA